jgi:hypothetical protein
MTDVQSVTEVAKGISEYGMMAITTAFYLLLSAVMMITIFKWFKSIINKMLEDYKTSAAQQQDCWQTLLMETQKQNEKLNGLVEGLRPETQLRIRNLTGFAFDLTIEQVCRLIKKVREENHIIDHEATAKKIRQLLKNIHEDRNSRFDTFTYNGEKLSVYCDERWIEDVAIVIENEIYNESGPNNGRAYTNVKMAYDNIKTEFYHNLNR